MMNIDLAPEIEDLIVDQVKSGRYPTVSSAIEAAIRLLASERQHESDLEQIRAALDQGLADSRAGRVRLFDPERLRAEALRRYGKSW